jgi:hypothetical protein
MTTGLTTPGRATVHSPVAPMYSEPFVRSTQISQCLSGHEVDLLEEQDDWYLSRGVDEYEGWIHRGFLSPKSNGGKRRQGRVERISLGCVAISGGVRRALPLGARLSPDETVASGDSIDETKLPKQFPRDADAITRSALQYFVGASYLWGGITPWGADCSGFVQSIFALHGIQLPRDAWQQSESGTDAGTWQELRPADLAFFTDREDKRVTHVAIALGDRRLVHLALGRGGYATESLDDREDGYVLKLRERFLKARRIL